MNAHEKSILAADANGTLAKAIEALTKYHARKDRREHPEGKFDNARRWYPSGADAAALDDSIRSPSRAWPYSYMIACRTLAHCERLCDVDHSVVLAARRAMKLAGTDECTPDLGVVRAWIASRALAQCPTAAGARTRSRA